MSRKNEENAVNCKIFQQAHVNEIAKRDDSKFNRVTTNMPTDEKLEAQ